MKATIAVLPGDGIGPEVTAEGVKALQAVARKFGHDFEFREGIIGGCSIDKTGTALPPETSALCKSADAVLLGAVGGPKWDDPNASVRPEQGLFAIRKELGLFANLRPVTCHPKLADASPLRPEVLKGVDLLVVRELTGGLYFGEKKREADFASDLLAYSGTEIRRVVRRAAEFARGRRKKLTSVDKANVLETSRLWRRITEELVRKEFPDVALEHILADSCAMYLMRKPASFDVIVTENMFGDILTDEASVLAGSMGLLPSASLGEGKRGLYEPIHGSAPRDRQSVRNHPQRGHAAALFAGPGGRGRRDREGGLHRGGSRSAARRHRAGRKQGRKHHRGRPSRRGGAVESRKV